MAPNSNTDTINSPWSSPSSFFSADSRPPEEEEIFVMELDEPATSSTMKESQPAVYMGIRIDDAKKAGFPSILAFNAYLHLKSHEDNIFHSQRTKAYMRSIAVKPNVFDEIAPEAINVKTCNDLLILSLYDGILFVDEFKAQEWHIVKSVEVNESDNSGHELGVWNGKWARGAMTNLTFDQFNECKTQYGWTEFGAELNLLMKVPLRHEEPATEVATIVTYDTKNMTHVGPKKHYHFTIPMNVDQNRPAVKFLREISDVSKLQSLLQAKAEMTIDVPPGDKAPYEFDRVLLVRNAGLTGFMRLKSYDGKAVF